MIPSNHPGLSVIWSEGLNESIVSKGEVIEVMALITLRAMPLSHSLRKPLITILVPVLPSVKC